MIARLQGRVAVLEDGAVILDVGGVGYRVHLPLPVLADLGPEGSSATLFTYLHVRENELELFGAADAESLATFRLLLGVSGIGPRVALAILSRFDTATIRQAIVAEDIARLSEVPGIGRRTAQRIVLELKAKLEAQGVTAEAPSGFAAADARGVDEALEALVSLGYPRAEARRALAGLPPEAGDSVEARILAALRVLGG